MASEYTFVSYSREQFYYAESLVLYLKHHGLSLWFDIQNIQPGMDWQQSIDEGLSSCTSLILVLSQKALDSLNVKYELQKALARNIPVYIVLFEAVPLPHELANASVIDGRISFKRTAGILARVITNGEVHRDKLPGAFSYYIPRLPLSLYRTLFLLWLASLCNITGLTILCLVLSMKIVFIMKTNSIPGVVSLLTEVAIILDWVYFCGYAFWYPFAFTLRKKFEFSSCIISVFSLGANFIAMLGFDLEYFNLLPAGSDALALRGQFYSLDNLLAPTFMVFAVIVGVISMLFLRYSGSSLHWYRTGSAPDDLRFDANSKWVVQPDSINIPVEKTYKLYYHESDKRLAEVVERQLTVADVLRPSLDRVPDYHIFLLTRNLSVSLLDFPLRVWKNIICIIGTDIQIPADKEAIKHLQWCDYRKRQPAQLDQFMKQLLKERTDLRSYSFHTLPESLERHILPSPLPLLNFLLRFVVALSAGLSIFLLTAPFNIFLRVCTALVLLLCCIYFFQLIHKIENQVAAVRSLAIGAALACCVTFCFDYLSIFVVSRAGVNTFLPLTISPTDFIAFLIPLLYMLFLLRRRKLLQNTFVVWRNTAFVLFLFPVTLFLCKIFEASSALQPDAMWVYHIEPTSIVAIVFTVFMFGSFIQGNFLPSRLHTLLYGTKPASSKEKEPTLAIERSFWYQDIPFLLFGFEIFCMLLVQSFVAR